MYCEATETLAALRRVFPCYWRLVSQRQPREKVPASQRRVRLARTADTRPDLATSARRLVPQTAPGRAYLSIPTSLTSSAASKKLGLPSLTGSAEQALVDYSESMCSEGAGEFLHSEHMLSLIHI